MYVCICQSVTDRDIRRQAGDGVRSFADLQARTGCATCCGCCESEARQVLANAVRDERMSLPMVAAA
ncbi:MAG TPA: (2Fe-2S)-binding protein [Oleiagrimonas sp.]|jgi:bacterioferritin-associated ferredoxin|nr:(2Fe-2S)-binding protein [Oleiagrimonas sp.]